MTQIVDRGLGNRYIEVRSTISHLSPLYAKHPMKFRQLGRTGIQVSTVCMGGWSISTKDFFWDHQSREDSIAAVHAALEAGVNFFDTAPAYGDGDSEQILGEALSGAVKRWSSPPRSARPISTRR